MNSQQKNITSFLIQHPGFFRDIMSHFYPLSETQLVKFKRIWNWQRISDNIHINWTVETIRQVADCLDWESFSTNPSAFKDLKAIITFDHLIDWNGDKNSCFDSIAQNTGLPWNKEFVERYKEKINFEKLSANTAVDWSEELIDLYRNKWHLKELAMNNAFPWTIRLFEKYLDTSLFFYHDVKCNKQFISNIDFIEKYSEHMEWSYIFANPELPWSEKGLMKRWKKKQDWFGIARNPVFFQNDPNFFNNNLIHWRELARCNLGKAISQNTALPWSVDFIAEYEALWDWEEISINTGIPWSKELIEKFSLQLIWGGESPCALCDEEGNYVSEFGGSSFQSGLVTNESLPWSIEFINQFNEFVDFETLAYNRGVWEKAFKPFLNDEMIEKIGTILLEIFKNR